MKIKEQILKLRKEGKSYNEIKKILNCSKGTISFHCSKDHIKSCLNCGKTTKNPKFCSVKCSIEKTHAKKTKQCASCSTLIHAKNKHCKKCQNTRNTKIQNMPLKEVIYGLDQDEANRYAKVRGRARTEYSNSSKSKHCIICGYSIHYEVAHIKPISKFDPDTKVSEVNHIDNLVALCKNHHWEFDHGYISEEKLRCLMNENT